MKVAYNSCFGGFGLSGEAIQLGREISGNPDWGEDVDDIERHDAVLVEVIERLGHKANDSLSRLAIRDIPAGAHYRIDEYDGNESVMTVEDYDWTIAQ